MFDFIIPFLVLILVVVFIHEYGHYYFAKKYGVGVTDFSIGFGKEIYGWNDKSGTRWKICMIPLGGYVKFFGDRNVFSQADQDKILKQYSEIDRKKLFVLKPLYQRALIVAAGPFANFILASSNQALYSSSVTTLTVIGMNACLIPHNSEHCP